MMPPIALVDMEEVSDEIERPFAKKRKISDPVTDAENSDDAVSLRHPLGVRPSGNAYLSESNLKLAMGQFALLPDELISLILEDFDASTLLRLGGTCRALHAFTRNDELWRALFTESPPSDFSWRGSWRSTLLGQDIKNEPKVDCSNLFSDVLHRPFFCAHIPFEPYYTNIPTRNQILRVSECDADFVFKSDRPLILTDFIKQWPVTSSWTIDSLLQSYSDIPFRAEAVDWKLSNYISYMRNNSDESPLYLFDRAFVEKMAPQTPSTAPSSPSSPSPLPYWPPTCFGPDQDLFSTLGPQRPDHRWLIIGPSRSGSTFHKDPNGTSAWNAVIRGRKYWIMFPSSPTLPTPPGVFVSDDQSEVTSPLSIAEWLLTFHAEARQSPGCREGICEAGEMLYVPAGWYHLVLNIEEGIALTQNFVPRHCLVDVLLFLRDKSDQVTGFRNVGDPYALFVEKLREKEPELLDDALRKIEVKKGVRVGRWEAIKATHGNEGENADGGFTFAFGGDDVVP